MTYIYFGFNNPLKYKRGVENIIHLQSKSIQDRKIYISYDDKTTCAKWGEIIYISIQKNIFRFLILNYILIFLRLRYDKKLFIHSHNYQLSYFSIFKTKVFTVHDGLTYLNKCFDKKMHYLYSIIEKSVYKRCDIIHVISKFSLNNLLIDEKSLKKVVIIYNSSPLESLPTTVKPIKSGHDYIFSVRSFEERARIDLLVETAKIMKMHSLPFDLKIAGKGTLFNYYQKLILDLQLDNIHLLGFVNDYNLKDLYSNCDLVLVTAEYGEGFGLPIIEGYMCDKPVIASKKCAIPEIIINESYLFNNNTDDILILLKAHIKNRDNYVKGEYSRYYFSNFSEDIIISKYKEKIYNID